MAEICSHIYTILARYTLAVHVSRWRKSASYYMCVCVCVFVGGRHQFCIIVCICGLEYKGVDGGWLQNRLSGLSMSTSIVLLQFIR